jgi:hypothetical protein
MDEGTRTIVSRSVLSEVLADEAVLLDLSSGVYYALNESGTFIWSLLERGCTEAELRSALAARYPDQLSALEADLTFFLDRLADKQLIRCRPEPG